MKQAEHQVTVYLTDSERADFAAYAQRFLLDAAGLLALLFAREMRVGRLRELIPRDAPPSGSRKAKVTARLKEPEHAALVSLAGVHGESLSQIGVVLVRAELSARWLEQAITTRFESRDGV